jgi:flagellar basal body P-ring protein FlgI
MSLIISKDTLKKKKKKLNKIIYENKRLGEIYQELKIKEALTTKNIY